MQNEINKGKLVIWQFAIISILPYFYGKISGYVVMYSGKDNYFKVELSETKFRKDDSVF